VDVAGLNDDHVASDYDCDEFGLLAGARAVGLVALQALARPPA
jgi:hypothetical protein